MPSKRTRVNAEPIGDLQQPARGPLVQSFREQIAQHLETSRRSDSDLREALLRNIEQKRQCAVLVREAKKTLRDDFSEAIAELLDDQAATEFIRFANQHPEPINDLRAACHSIELALKLSAALPWSSGHGKQN